MTIRARFEEKLCRCGMFPDQAGVVLILTERELPDMTGRWDEDESGYPPELMAALWMGVEQQALVWIDANLPQAWYRPMFVAETTAPSSPGTTANPEWSTKQELLAALKASRDVLASCADDAAGTTSEDFFKAKVSHCDIVIAKAENR